MPVPSPAKSRKTKVVVGSLPFHVIERKTVPKEWGYEYWIVNTPQYCGKLLVMGEGWASSLHCHQVKDETMLILDGSAVMETKPNGLDGPSEYTMMRAEERTSIRIPPGLYHRLMTSVGFDCVIAEFSTSHDEDDVTRAEVSKGLYEPRCDNNRRDAGLGEQAASCAAD